MELVDMSADEKFDFIDLAAYQYEKYCKVVLQKKRLSADEIEVMLGALNIDGGWKDGVRYLLETGSAGYGYSCAFSRSLERNWRRIPFPVPEGKEGIVQRVAEMDVYIFDELRSRAPSLARYQYTWLSDLLGVSESYAGSAENPFVVEVPDALRNATMLFETERIPMNLCNAELFSETLRETWMRIPLIGAARRRLEEIATMTVEEYQDRI